VNTHSSDSPVVAVLYGSDSAEREVSLVSGREVAKALTNEGLLVELYDLPGKELPAALDPARHVVFPALHGGWGENGGVQAALEARGFAYAGCGPEASRLCMDKVQTKNVMAHHRYRRGNGHAGVKLRLLWIRASPLPPIPLSFVTNL